jgi:hypothetical protein
MPRPTPTGPRTELHARDNFTSSVRKAIAARTGWRCSNPDCRAATTGPVSDPGGASVVGVAAHIAAATRGGPRFDPALTSLARKSATNGIWLCGVCAKMIDDDCSRYSIAILRFWKLDDLGVY